MRTTRRDRGGMVASVAALFGVLLMACSTVEVPEQELGAITFGAEANGLHTRALVDNGTLVNGGASVYVAAMRNGSTQLYPVSSTSQGERIYRDATTAKWLPTSTNRKTWQTGSTYDFNGFSYLPATATSNGSLTINSNGKQIIVEQPSSYNESLMVDYLYSHTFKVSDGIMRPLVQLDLEHALALVEVKIAKHPSITEAFLESVTIEGFYRRATMNCTTPAIYNSGGTNEWKVEFAAGTTKDTSYTRSGGDPSDPASLTELVTRDDEGSVVMRLVAIPQQMEADNRLHVVYWVNEKFDDSSPDKFVRHTASFNLYNYNPIMWRSGHRITYTLVVDTGIHLQGVINPWVDVDYIEGTVLPEI